MTTKWSAQFFPAPPPPDSRASWGKEVNEGHLSGTDSNTTVIGVPIVEGKCLIRIRSETNKRPLTAVQLLETIRGSPTIRINSSWSRFCTEGDVRTVIPVQAVNNIRRKWQLHTWYSIVLPSHVVYLHPGFEIHKCRKKIILISYQYLLHILFIKSENHMIDIRMIFGVFTVGKSHIQIWSQMQFLRSITI